MITIRPYVAVVAAVSVFVSPILGTLAAVQISRGSEAKLEDVRRQSSCELFGRLLDVYTETPPSTPAGRNVQEAYRLYYNDTLHCVPPR